MLFGTAEKENRVVLFTGRGTEIREEQQLRAQGKESRNQIKNR